MRIAFDASSIATDSVISQVRSCGLMAWRRSAMSMRSARSGWRSWCAERLIATRICRPWSRQTPAWRQASSISQLPIALIRPKRSAIGMNWSGPTRPRVGCSQRISASAPVISPLGAWIFGW